MKCRGRCGGPTPRRRDVPRPRPGSYHRVPGPTGGAGRAAAALRLPAGAGPAGAHHPRRGGGPAQRATGPATGLHPEHRPQVARPLGRRRRASRRRRRRPPRPGTGHRRRLGRRPARGCPRDLHRRADRADRQPRLPPPGTVRAPRRRLDATRAGRRSNHPRPRPPHFAPLGRAFLNWTPIGSRTVAAIGSTPRPSRPIRRPSPPRSRPSAPPTPTRRCWRRWAATSSAPTR